MNEITLKSLGLTEESLTEKLIDRLSDNIMSGVKYDEDGDYIGSSPFANKLNKMVQEQLDAKVNEIAEKHLLPKISDMVENLVLQQTNAWGEAKGKSVSFIEYMTARAENYMTEKVSFDGKTKGESGSFGWSANTTRVAYMIDKHLQYSISNAMKAALKDANSKIADGLSQAVKIQLEQATSKINVNVKF